jgi:hypothetical protein
VNRYPLGCEGQVNMLTYMFSSIDWPTNISGMRWWETDGLQVHEDDVEGSEWMIRI